MYRSVFDVRPLELCKALTFFTSIVKAIKKVGGGHSVDMDFQTMTCYPSEQDYYKHMQSVP